MKGYDTSKPDVKTINNKSRKSVITDQKQIIEPVANEHLTKRYK